MSEYFFVCVCVCVWVRARAHIPSYAHLHQVGVEAWFGDMHHNGQKKWKETYCK